MAPDLDRRGVDVVLELVDLDAKRFFIRRRRRRRRARLFDPRGIGIEGRCPAFFTIFGNN